jgi:hypothetical protein
VNHLPRWRAQADHLKAHAKKLRKRASRAYHTKNLIGTPLRFEFVVLIREDWSSQTSSTKGQMTLEEFQHVIHSLLSAVVTLANQQGVHIPALEEQMGRKP